MELALRSFCPIKGHLLKACLCFSYFSSAHKMDKAYLPICLLNKVAEGCPLLPTVSTNPNWWGYQGVNGSLLQISHKWLCMVITLPGFSSGGSSVWASVFEERLG